MKKRIFSLFLAMVLCLSLLPTGVLAGEPEIITSETDRLSGGNTAEAAVTYKLEDNVSSSNLITVRGHVILDLNGHTLALSNNFLIGEDILPSDAVLTLIDSSEDGTGTLEITSISSTLYICGTLNANGGTVKGGVSNGGTLTCTGAESTVFVGGIVYNGVFGSSLNGTISGGIFKGAVFNNNTVTGGIFYGGLSHTTNGQVDGKQITFLSNDETYAIEVLNGNASSYAPEVPTREGYTFDGWYDEAHDTENAFVFDSAIDSDLTLTARWTQNRNDWLFPALLTLTGSRGSRSFADVADSDWYHDAVRWATENDITDGVSDDRFGPAQSCTRAQFVTFLWRAAGEPLAGYAVRFTDTDADSYYGQAVAWAASLGMIQGYGDGSFGPGDPVTRQQAAVMLYRFATAWGLDVRVGTDTNILSYLDIDGVADYAFEALHWACGAGVVQGTNGSLLPNAPCTRAQIVTMLYRMLG